MLHLSSFHSNGLPTVVWSNRVNLIGEKVYKPKIHFCEHCNKPILIYGRLIPCKHVFCFSCATLCLTQQQHHQHTNPLTAPTQQELSLDSPASNNSNVAANAPGTPGQPQASSIGKGCHRCGGKALRVERNLLNSIFVCQIESCRRTYLSARDLQAHVNHRHSKNKSNNNHNGTSTSASLAAISSSPYISSSSLMHLNGQNNSSNGNNSNHSTNSNYQMRQSASSSTVNHSGNNHSPSYLNHQQHHNRHERDHHNVRGRDRDRFRDRDNYQRDRERERDSKEYHRQSIQRAAQWAEASAQMMEKGFTR